MNEFDLRGYLYNNPLLESEAKLKAAKKKLEKQEDKLDKVDMKDEDAKENIYTIPVLYGEKYSIIISHLSIFLSMIIYYFNNNFYNTIYISSLFELQNFGSFFLNYNKTQ